MKKSSKKKAATTGDRLEGFGARLRELREKRGLTQQDVADAVGAHWMQISRYERGVQLPTADRVVALVKVLRVTADGLLLGKPKSEEALDFKNVRLYERLRQLDQLPREDQDVVLKLIDAVLTKHRVANAMRE